MIVAYPKLEIGHLVLVEGEVTLISADDNGHLRMTVRFVGAPSPINLDASWSNRDPETLKLGDAVRLEGKLLRINSASNPRWKTGTIKLDGYPYPTTLLISDLQHMPPSKPSSGAGHIR